MLSKIKSKKKKNHNPFRKYKNEKIIYIAQQFYKQVYLKCKYLKLNQSQATLPTINESFCKITSF